MALKPGCRRSCIRRCNKPSYAPSRHCIRFCNAVHHNKLPADIGLQCTDMRSFSTVIHKMLIDLIRQDPYPVLKRPPGNIPQNLFRPYGSCRVIRRIDNDRLRCRRPDPLQLFNSRLKISVCSSRHTHRYASGKLYSFSVAHPVGGRDNHFIPRIGNYLYCLIYCLLTAISDHDISRIGRVSGIP